MVRIRRHATYIYIKTEIYPHLNMIHTTHCIYCVYMDNIFILYLIREYVPQACNIYSPFISILFYIQCIFLDYQVVRRWGKRRIKKKRKLNNQTRCVWVLLACTYTHTQIHVFISFYFIPFSVTALVVVAVSDGMMMSTGQGGMFGKTFATRSAWYVVEKCPPDTLRKHTHSTQ